MSWRRFQVLIRCLSPQSATVTKLQGERYIGQKAGQQQVVTVEGAANVERSLAILYGK